MIHPNLGKHDLSQKKFYNVIYIVSFLTLVIVSIVLWQVESRADAAPETATDMEAVIE